MVGYLISLAIFTTTYALFSLGLNLQWGYTGLINFGHIAFMTVGAYTTVLLSINGVPLFLAVLAGAIAAAFLGLLIGFSTLRLRTDYLAIVTIGMSEVVRLIALNEEDITRGTRGVYGYPLPLAQSNPNWPLKLVMITLLTLVFGIGIWRLWQWIGRQLDGERSPTPVHASLAFMGYLLCLGGTLAILWQGFAVNPAFGIVALVPAGLGVGIAYVPLKQPARQFKQQLWSFNLSLWVTNLGIGFVLLVYWAGVQGLLTYTRRDYKVLLMWLLIMTVALVFWQLQRLVHSPWGRVLKSIREDEEVPRALGKNVLRYKLQAFMIGGAIASIAGSFYAWQLSYINPDGFIPLITFQAWIIVVLGGSGNNVGTLLGAAIFWAYDAATRFILPHIVPLDDARLGAFRIMVIGLLLILLMMWQPQGILGKKEELTLGQ